MPRWLRISLGLFIAALMIGGPLVYSWRQEEEMRNVRVVKEGVLYRSGQLSRAGLARVIHDFGIKTVITLRDTEDPRLPPPDWAEEEWCKKMDIQYVRITPRSWWRDDDGSAPADPGVRRFLDVVSNPDNHPVLVHCFAGIHRTGNHCAIYRMEFEGWSNERAIAELRALGYDNLDNELDVLSYLESYQPGRRGWFCDRTD